MPKEEARKKLMELLRIDKKTVDALLVQRHSYAEVMVVDTHFERIAKRLGLVKSDAKYEDIQKVLKTFTPWERGERTAGLLWLLAKYIARHRTRSATNAQSSNYATTGAKTEGNKETKAA